jgi:UDP-N-acetylglucosamine 4-epimerase
MEIIGLRYFNVFGKRQDPTGEYAAAIPKFIRSFMKKQSPVIFGDGNQSRDFTYIDNVIQINQLAALTTLPESLDTVYNVAFGQETSLNDLTQILSQLLSMYDPLIKDVKPVYAEERSGDIKHSIASIEKAKNMLGYNPKFSLKQGLEIAIDWYWNNLK